MNGKLPFWNWSKAATIQFQRGGSWFAKFTWEARGSDRLGYIPEHCCIAARTPRGFALFCEYDQELENDGTWAELKLVRVNGTEVAGTLIELEMIIMSGDERSEGI